MGSGGGATPCKVTREDRRPCFLMCRVSFKAHGHTAFNDVPPSTQFSRMFCHPHETQELHLEGSCDNALGHRPHERQGADPRTVPFEGTPNEKSLFNLDVGDELFEIVRRAGRLRAFADLNGEMSERGWVHWMVFGGSFYLIPSAYSVFIVAPSVWIWAQPFSTHLVMIVDADAVSQRLRGSSACCVRALPGTRCPHESNRHETGTCHVIFLRPLGAHVRTRRHTLDSPWMLGVSAVSIRCLRSGLHCYPRQISLFSGFHDSLFLTLVKGDRWHPQGYCCSNGDDENDVIGADSVVL